MIRLEIEKMLAKRNKSKYWLIKKLRTSYPVINKLIKGETTTLSFYMLEEMLYYLDCSVEEWISYRKETDEIDNKKLDVKKG